MRLTIVPFWSYMDTVPLAPKGMGAQEQMTGMNGTDLSKIEILVILIINVLRLSDAAKSCLSP